MDLRYNFKKNLLKPIVIKNIYRSLILVFLSMVMVEAQALKDCLLDKNVLVCGMEQFDLKMLISFNQTINLRMILENKTTKVFKESDDDYDFIFSNRGKISLDSKDIVQEKSMNRKYLDKITNVLKFQVDLLNFQSIDANIVQLPRLTAINGRGNLIADLESDIFDTPGVNKITDINLAANKISRIHEKAFYGLFKLKYLYLQQNMIHILSKLTFMFLTNLQVLDLSFNQLETFSKELLNHNMHIETVDLQHNKIYQIYLGYSDPVNRNILFILEGNYLDENEHTKRICSNKLHKVENASVTQSLLFDEDIKHKLASHLKFKKEFYVQIQNLMMSYLIVIIISLSFVAFVINVFGDPSGTIPDDESSEIMEIQTAETTPKYGTYEVIDPRRLQGVVDDSSDDLYAEIGPGTSTALKTTTF